MSLDQSRELPMPEAGLSDFPKPQGRAGLVNGLLNDLFYADRWEEALTFLEDPSSLLDVDLAGHFQQWLQVYRYFHAEFYQSLRDQKSIDFLTLGSFFTLPFPRFQKVFLLIVLYELGVDPERLVSIERSLGIELRSRARNLKTANPWNAFSRAFREQGDFSDMDPYARSLADRFFPDSFEAIRFEHKKPLAPTATVAPKPKPELSKVTSTSTQKSDVALRALRTTLNDPRCSHHLLWRTLRSGDIEESSAVLDLLRDAFHTMLARAVSSGDLNFVQERLFDWWEFPRSFGLEIRDVQRLQRELIRGRFDRLQLLSGDTLVVESSNPTDGTSKAAHNN